jgi:beta-galactosidase GanA
LIVLSGSAIGQTTGPQAALPHLEKRGNATQLIVDGKPFLILGAEVHNSSSSSVEYMEVVWPHLQAMHMNTVVLPVAWETIEPDEGKFNFQCVDGLLKGARAHNLKIVFLWFGAWKNTYSSYAPAWVKTNTDRFPRVQLSDGRDTERLSPFSVAVREADQRAFAALMDHLREADGKAHTVLFMQVENEVGVIPEARDHSSAANTAFEAPVPQALMSYLEKHRTTLAPELSAAWEAAGAKASGTWQQVFGKTPLTDDLFMAWQYATYIEHIAAAGKEKYPLPMYANAALIRPNYEPGQYDSGGPLPHSADVWRAGAPSLDFLSPDIYFNEFAQWSSSYSRPGNPLFIPESQGGATGAANSLYAFGRLSAIGFSPFGVDDAGNAPLDLVGITNPAERPDNDAIAAIYAELSRLSPLILEKQSSGGITAGLMEGDAQRAARVPLGDFTANITRAGGGAGTRVAAMFLQTGPNEFLVVGVGDAQITFSSDKPGPPIVGIVSIDEEYYENGAWVPRRRLNGDENSQGQALRLYASDPSQGRIYQVRLYRY